MEKKNKVGINIQKKTQQTRQTIIKKITEKTLQYQTEISALITYCLIAIITTWPLILNLTTEVYGKYFYQYSDPIGGLYLMWWDNYAITHGLNIINNTMIALSQGGISTVLWSPYIPAMSFLFSILGNQILVYNLIMLSSIPLSAITMFILTKHFTKNNTSSFISGIIYAFAPYHFIRIQLDTTLAQMQWMPLYILFLFKLDEKPNTANAILCGALLALNFFTDYYYAAFMLAATVTYIIAKIIYQVLKKDLQINKEKIKKTLIAITTFLILFTIFNYPLITNYLTQGPPITRSYANVQTGSTTSLAYYLIPYYQNPLFKNTIINNLGSYINGTASEVEQEIYISYTSLILATLLIIYWIYKKTQKQKTNLNNQAIIFFILLAILGVIMSIGPQPKVLGVQFNNITYYLYQISPTLRTYIRSAVLVFISVSALAGMAIQQILQYKTKPKTTSNAFQQKA